MRELKKMVMVALLSVPLACSAGRSTDEPLQVVVTFSVLADLVETVAAERAHVEVLVPRGAEVHEWELSPSNFIALEQADLVFYNGYQLEQWMPQLRETVSTSVPVIALAEAADYPTQPIVTGEYEGEPDPHLWMSPRAAAAYVDIVAAELARLRPAHEEEFTRRARELNAALQALHGEMQHLLADIPESRRLLITSEAAFVYFAEAFGFEHDGVWGTNAETDGSPRQIMRIVDRVRQHRPAAVFWESTISDRHVRAIAADTGVDVAGPLYVDSLGEPDGEAADYFSMMRHNARLLRDRLGAEDAGE